MDSTSAYPNRRIILVIALALIVISALLVATALTLGEERFQWLFDEGGPVEDASMWGWIVLSVLCLVILRSVTLASLSGSVLCLAAAAREADWHKEFTGYSVMKIGFYHHPEYGVGARLLAFVIMALVITSAVIVIRSLVRNWRESPQNAPEWGVVACISIGWLVAMKVADRFRDVFGSLTGIEFGDTSKNILSAWEEGGELLLPVLFGVTVWMFARTERETRAQKSSATIEDRR